MKRCFNGISKRKYDFNSSQLTLRSRAYMRHSLDLVSVSALIGTHCCHHMRHGLDPTKSVRDKSGIGAEEFKL